MTHRHRRRIGASIIALAAVALLPGAALAGPPNLPPWAIVGSPEADELDGTPRADTIFGLGGPDVIHAGFGSDRVFAGAGDDKVRGGYGADTIRGGPGADRIASGPGNDLVLAAGDGAIDTILCGDGRQDLAIVDPDDVVASDCEFIWVRDPES
jgi:Ca2+-binding RTX toxin-like protein